VGQAESSTVSVEFCVAVEDDEEEVVVVWLEDVGLLVDDDELCDVDDELDVGGMLLLIEEVLELEELEKVCVELDEVVVEELLDCDSSTAAAAPMITIMIMTTAITTL
jgi:hypothetical protein